MRVSKKTASVGVTASFASVNFSRFKAFENFTVGLEPFNILVGPNNAGKSTIISAFRILSAAIKKARTRRAEIVDGPKGRQYGYKVELKDLSVAEENLFFNYKDSIPAIITFTLSNQYQLILFFDAIDSCVLLVEADGKRIVSPADFKSNFPCDIGFVPVLGPVEHEEDLNTPETARAALYNARASRNFRNIWYHNPEDFQEFRQLVQNTWPNMDVGQPERIATDKKPILKMLCPEGRIPREIAWAGYGFQVWCQILTQIVKAKKKSLFIIDEPDIYLHSDLQRQLLGILRDLRCDVIIATHSTEIISESELGELVLVDKKNKHSKRIKNSPQIKDALKSVGTNLNVALTQVSKTGKVVFVEGTDMTLLSKLAKRAGYSDIASRRGFAVIPLGGFRPEAAKQQLAGMAEVYGDKISAALILDRDFRCEEEVRDLKSRCSAFLKITHIHRRKEIENYLLVPAAIDSCIQMVIIESRKRGYKTGEFHAFASVKLAEFAEANKSDSLAQFVTDYAAYYRPKSSGKSASTINKEAVIEFEAGWKQEANPSKKLSGKSALAYLASYVSDEFKVTLTSAAIIEAMEKEDISSDLIDLFSGLQTL